MFTKLCTQHVRILVLLYASFKQYCLLGVEFLVVKKERELTNIIMLIHLSSKGNG